MGMSRLIDANKAFERADEVTFMGFRAEERKKHFMDLVAEILKQSTVIAVDVKQYEALREQYHELRENFIDYVCSGTCNVAPYCLNRCEGCVDRVGWCSQGSDECRGFNPAELII